MTRAEEPSGDAPRSDPPRSDAVAAAEAEIAQTRRNLAAALAGLRRELAVPIVAVKATAALFEEAAQGTQLRDFVRRNALSLGLIGLGAVWLAVQNRGTLGTLGGSWAREVVEGPRALANSAAKAALSAALQELGRPTAEPPGRSPQPAPAPTAPPNLPAPTDRE
jgi:hypothetical protein